MPLFFVLSGYTIKEYTSKKDFQRLIIPCIIVSFIISLIQFPVSEYGFKYFILHYIASLIGGSYSLNIFGINLPYIGRIWFLISLFWTKLFYRIMLTKIKKHRLIVLIILSCVSLLIQNYVWLPQGFDFMFISMTFMEFGYLLKNKFNYIDKIKKYCIVVASLITWLSCVFCFDVSLNMNKRQFNYGMVSIGVAILGCICVIEFSKILSNTIFSKMLIFFGKHSFELLIINSMYPYFITVDFNKSVLLQACFALLLHTVIVFLWIFLKRIKNILISFS